MSDELREQLAAVQHEIWAHWMRYMFTCGQFGPDGSWTMPTDKVERWQRQMSTPYSDLTDKERESDRHQADKVLAVVSADLAAAKARIVAVEAQLAAVQEYATYYVCAWEQFEADSDGPEPLDFDDWLAERQQTEVQP